jgi:ABC-type transport system involved in multi-copper enzyme maturation permease subunit
MIGVIAKREAIALFRTPLAWALLAMTQFVLAYQFLAQIEIYLQFEDKLRSMPDAPGITEVVVTPTIGTAAMLMLFVIPVLTMSSICGERRNGTLALLYSSPVRCADIIVGKFFGVCFLLSLVWAIVALMPLSLMWGAPLDLRTYACGAGVANDDLRGDWRDVLNPIHATCGGSSDELRLVGRTVVNRLGDALGTRCRLVCLLIKP